MSGGGKCLHKVRIRKTLLKNKKNVLRRFCPKDISSRSAEAFKCVDNMGVLHEENQTYTHVDGCNTCKCGKHGGACTRRFCVKKEVVTYLIAKFVTNDDLYRRELSHPA